MQKYLFFYIITSLLLLANTTPSSKSKDIKADLVTVIKSQRKMYLSCKGKILKKYSKSILKDKSVNGVISMLSNGIEQLLQDVQINIDVVKGIGIGAPGIIDIDRGLIIASPNLQGWKNVPLKNLETGRLTL